METNIVSGIALNSEEVSGTGLLITMSIAWLQWHMLLSCQDKSTKSCRPQDLLEGLVTAAVKHRHLPLLGSNVTLVLGCLHRITSPMRSSTTEHHLGIC